MYKAASLLDLPPELLVHILSYLPLPDLAACARTSHPLYTLIKSSALLNYIIELRARGFEDNPACPLSIKERLRRLQARENAWRTLEFSLVTVVQVNFYSSSVYDLSGGILLLGESPYERSPFVNGETCALRYIRLPSSESNPGDLSWSWSRIDIKARIIDVGLAVEEHDLIAIAAHPSQPERRDHLSVIDVHLIKLTTHDYHPLANQAVIHIPLASAEPVTHCSVQFEIVGDMLGIIVNFPYVRDAPLGKLFIYNWKTGVQRYFRSAGSSVYSAFTFLSLDVLVLANCADACLELCRIDPASAADAPQELETVHTLGLPALAPSAMMTQIICRAEPSPRASPPARARPFCADAAAAVAIFMFFIRRGAHLHAFSMFVHRGALLACAGARGTTPWAAWGPHATRWLRGTSGNDSWITTTCGQRHSAVAEDALVSVLDFSPYAVRRRAPGLEPAWVGGNVRAVTGEAAVEDEVFAEGRVVSALPYLETRDLRAWWYDNVLLDEERMIGVNLDEADNVGEITIHLVAKRDSTTVPP